MKYVRSYATDDGESHFEDLDLELKPVEYFQGEAPVSHSDALPTRGTTFGHVPPRGASEWHNTPRRQFAITLAGGAEVKTTDGGIRRFGPGDVWLVEDTTGRGHQTTALPPDGWLYALMPLAE